MKQIPHAKGNPYELNRKDSRLKNYDYSRSGIYYVTFCTYERICYLRDGDDANLRYYNQGSLAEAFLNMMSVFNQNVEVLDYVVMPDHIHVLLSLNNDEADKRYFEECHDLDITLDRAKVQKDSLSSIIGHFKASITRHCRRQHLEMKWQKGFYDRVIRTNEELDSIKKYIRENESMWDVERTVNPMGWPV